MIIRLISSGKSSVLSGKINADHYIDCRVVSNPFRDPHLGGKTGDDPEVQTWMAKENSEFLRSAVKMIELGVKTAPTRNSFKGFNTLPIEGAIPIGVDSLEAPKAFTVCFFCLAGVHRSRASKNVVANMLKQKGYQVEVVK